MSRRLKILLASIGAAAALVGVFSEMRLYVPAMICCGWMTLVAVCNWIAEWRDEQGRP